MDLLIEALVALLRAFFGEPVKPPDSSGADRARPFARGPYKYGDERSSRPKSLEEMLEEVRREATMKRQGGTGAPARAEKPAPLESAPPPIPRKPLIEEEVEEEPDEAEEKNIRRLVRETPQPVPAETAARELAARVETKSRPAPQLSRPSNSLEESRPEPAMPAQQLAASAAGFNILREMGNAPGNLKVMLSRQAIIAHEVFGPPRSLRPYRPGRRF